MDQDVRGSPSEGRGHLERGNDWATFDALMGVDAIDKPGVDIGPLAFYGRCSTEDNQDPETSRAWQLNNATKFVQPLGGHIAAEFFDIGQSRSVPSERREAASALLSRVRAAMDAQVVNEVGIRAVARPMATPWSTVVRIPSRERQQRAIVFAYRPSMSRQRKSFGASLRSTWTVEATAQSLLG